VNENFSRPGQRDSVPVEDLVQMLNVTHIAYPRAFLQRLVRLAACMMFFSPMSTHLIPTGQPSSRAVLLASIMVLSFCTSMTGPG